MFRDLGAVVPVHLYHCRLQSTVQATNRVMTTTKVGELGSAYANRSHITVYCFIT
jgi:hypothetical protein